MSNFALPDLLQATIETLYMVFLASFISAIVGLAVGSLLFITGKSQNAADQFWHRTLGFIVNVTRSVPFIILMISIIPLTRLLVGTSIGINAAIVPLTIAATAFFARVAENALAEVPHGLIETANAMGATTWQTLTKVLIPESASGLIRGLTLTIIGLIGYSAMAGVVGGGGLGELAINYGYQRFNVVVMLETVVVLIILVQLIQWLGDQLAKTHQFKTTIAASLLFLIACIGMQWSQSSATQTNVVRVGVISGWPEKVMAVAADLAEKKYHLHLKIVTFSDYVQPNTALNNHDIDANIFQHQPYLEAQMKAHGYQLASIGKTFVYPMGFYSNKIKNIDALPDGALVAIPSDPSNGGRALLLLQKYGLIKLKKGVGTLATINDIASNPRQLHFKQLDTAALPRVLNDADLVAITNDFVGPAGLNIQQAIIKEGSDSAYANIIVIRKDDLKQPYVSELLNVMHSEPVLQATEKIFPNGESIPAWDNHKK